MKTSLVDDIRIEKLRPIISPALLMEELALTEKHATVIRQSRDDIKRIIKGKDDRLLVVVGPCSIHDTTAALEYAAKLALIAKQLRHDLCIVMRVYFEKPRTTIGWKGLINDPNLNNTFNINQGLKLARKLLLDVTNLGLPVGTEFLDTIVPQYISDLVAWGAIGARTTECQLHRELSSGLSMPVGFKNGTNGSVTIAMDAIQSARSQHHFLSITKLGATAIVMVLSKLSPI